MYINNRDSLIIRSTMNNDSTKEYLGTEQAFLKTRAEAQLFEYVDLERLIIDKARSSDRTLRILSIGHDDGPSLFLPAISIAMQDFFLNPHTNPTLAIAIRSITIQWIGVITELSITPTRKTELIEASESLKPKRTLPNINITFDFIQKSKADLNGISKLFGDKKADIIKVSHPNMLDQNLQDMIGKNLIECCHLNTVLMLSFYANYESYLCAQLMRNIFEIHKALIRTTYKIEKNKPSTKQQFNQWQKIDSSNFFENVTKGKYAQGPTLELMRKRKRYMHLCTPLDRQNDTGRVNRNYHKLFEGQHPGFFEESFSKKIFEDIPKGPDWIINLPLDSKAKPYNTREAVARSIGTKTTVEAQQITLCNRIGRCHAKGCFEQARIQNIFSQKSFCSANCLPSTESSAVILSKKRSCHVCQRPAPQKCSRCESVYYCSVDCQKRDWDTHKSICTKPSRPETS